MPKATLPNKLYPISLEFYIDNYPDESLRPTFFVIMPTMEEEESLASFVDIFREASSYTKLHDLHSAACKIVTPFIKGWSNFTDREGNAIEYKGEESLLKVLVLMEVHQLSRALVALATVSYQEKKTSEPSASSATV